MSIEQAVCPKCGNREAGFNPADGDLWCPTCNGFARETIHILDGATAATSVNTLCGLWWAGNLGIGGVTVWNLEEYRARDDCQICEACDAALTERRARAQMRRG